MRWTHITWAANQRKQSTLFDRLLWFPFALERFDCFIHSFREGILILKCHTIKERRLKIEQFFATAHFQPFIDARI